jgi:hypothetical protein
VIVPLIFNLSIKCLYNRDLDYFYTKIIIYKHIFLIIFKFGDSWSHHIILQWTQSNNYSCDRHVLSFTWHTVTLLHVISCSAAEVSKDDSVAQQTDFYKQILRTLHMQHVLFFSLVSFSSQHLQRTNVCLWVNRGVLCCSSDIVFPVQSKRRPLYEGTEQLCAICARMFNYSHSQNKQDRQCMHNVTLRHVLSTIVAVEKR